MKRVPWCLLMFASLLTANAHASPFEIEGLDASSQYELKVLAEIETCGTETILEGPALDWTIPITARPEASITGGVGRLTLNGEERSLGGA